MAVLAITAEARHVKNTRTRGNAKMLSLVQKMKQRAPAPSAPAMIGDDCDGQMCPGDWCCTQADWTCCDEDSAYVCVEDPDTCDDCPGQVCDGDYCCPDADWTCCDEDSDYICVSADEDCDDSTERTKGNARMNPLLMKMRQRHNIKSMKAPNAPAKPVDDCDGQVCPGDFCCPDADFICCDEDSTDICVKDDQECQYSTERSKGNARMTPLLMKMRQRHNIKSMKAPKTPAKAVDDCDGKMCFGDWCCPEDDWTCCDPDSPWICAEDGDKC